MKRIKCMKKAPKKSKLVKQAEKIFRYQPGTPPVVAYEPYLTYPSEPTVVQTFTTYSVCEDPIPNPYKKP
jgi:hypothetical protein